MWRLWTGEGCQEPPGAVLAWGGKGCVPVLLLLCPRAPVPLSLCPCPCPCVPVPVSLCSCPHAPVSVPCAPVSVPLCSCLCALCPCPRAPVPVSLCPCVPALCSCSWLWDSPCAVPVALCQSHLSECQAFIPQTHLSQPGALCVLSQCFALQTSLPRSLWLWGCFSTSAASGTQGEGCQPGEGSVAALEGCAGAVSAFLLGWLVLPHHGW